MKESRDGPPPGRVRTGWDRSLRAGWCWLALLLVGYFTFCAFHPRVLFALGVQHYNAWFIDTFALLASNDAVTRGLDPHAANPLDYLQRPHVYSHWWLHLRDLGLTRANSFGVGLTLVIAFLATALGRLRPQSVRQVLWYAAVLGCPAVLLALDRANNDLVIFIVLAPVVPCLLRGRRLEWWLATLLIVAATALKYYPAVAVVLLCVVPDPRELRARLLIGGLLVALAIVSVAGDLTHFATLVPQPEGLTNFGATGFFNELGWVGWPPRLTAAAIGLLLVIYFWFRGGLGEWEPEPGQQRDWLHFLLGALLLTGCFFTSMNFGYRWIFSIWLAPLLWTLTRATTSPAPVRRLARVTGWLLVAVLWWAAFGCVVMNSLIGVVAPATIMRLARIFFLLEQPMDWAFFACLLVFLTHFLRQRFRAPARRSVFPAES